MRAFAWWWCLTPALAALLGGCAAAARPVPPAPPVPVEPNPFDDDSASFIVPSAHFAPGETAIVKVCVSPEGAIASADVVGSSGDKHFDDLAIQWARQVRLKSMPAGALTAPVCGPVRVEIRPAPAEGIGARQQSALG